MTTLLTAHTGGRYWWAFLADHALFVGVPIGVLTSRADPRPSR